MKLGLMNNFIKGINHEEKTFKYVGEKFSILSPAKVFLLGHKFNSLDLAFDRFLKGFKKKLVKL